MKIMPGGVWNEWDEKRNCLRRTFRLQKSGKNEKSEYSKYTEKLSVVKITK